MIFIVIDNAPLPAKVLGVYREHKLAEDFLLAIPEGETDEIEVICWDIVNNFEVA